MFRSLRMAKDAFYAVARGRQTGIFRSWPDCESQVKGFYNNAFKKFKTQKEAQDYLDGQPPSKKQKSMPTSVSFSKAMDQIQSTSKQAEVKQEPGTEVKREQYSDDELFLELREYPDEPTSSAQEPKRKARSGAPANALPIKFKPPAPTSPKKYNGIEFQEDSKGFVHVYTDGSSLKNGQFTAAAGFGVYFGENHILNVAEPVTGRPTNNVGEIQAAIRAIRDAQTYGIRRLNIFTDSQFLINSACMWMSGWKRKGWKLASGKTVVNHKDFIELDNLIESGSMMIEWSYIPAHKGFQGNEEADKLAKIGASMYRSRKEKDEDGSDNDDYTNPNQ